MNEQSMKRLIPKVRKALDAKNLDPLDAWAALTVHLFVDSSEASELSAAVEALLRCWDIARNISRDPERG